MSNPVVLITGGLTGIGRAAAVAFAQKGASLFGCKNRSKDNPAIHHDALEFPDGRIALLTYLEEGQTATVLQLPAAAVNTQQRALSRRS